jgi:hypothetical protein
MKKIFLLFLISFLLLIFNLTVYSQTYTELTTNVTVQLTSVSSSIGMPWVWICGYSGTVLRSTNNGTNITNVSSGIPATAQLISIWGIDANTALVTGYTGTSTWVWKTTNAGVNWTQVFTETGFIDAFWFSSATNGLMVGDPVNLRWSLWKTTNGGSNWDSTGMFVAAATAAEGGYNNAMFGNGTNVWFGTNNTKVYYSSNSGVSWTAQSTAPEVNSYSIFWNGIRGFAGGATLMMTTNSGTNWNPYTSAGTGNIGGIIGTYTIGALIWYVRTSTAIYQSSYGGPFISVYTAPAGNYRYITIDRNSSYFGYGYGVRVNGGVTRFIYLLEGVQPVSNEIPSKMNLKQNYPNPFNPATTIKFDINKSGFVRLNVYDIQGRVVGELVKETLSPGTYEVSFNGENYTSGVYFYKLMTDGFVETKRMILVK